MPGAAGHVWRPEEVAEENTSRFGNREEIGTKRKKKELGWGRIRRDSGRTWPLGQAFGHKLGFD